MYLYKASIQSDWESRSDFHDPLVFELTVVHHKCTFLMVKFPANLILSTSRAFLTTAWSPALQKFQTQYIHYKVKVTINPKYFFCLNKSLHLFETHCAFLNEVLTFFYVVKVTKSSHHLSHDRASKGMGLFLVWRHKLIFIVLSLCKHACKEVGDLKQGVDPYLLLAQSCDRWWPDYVTFTACKRSIFGFKRGTKAQCISNRYKDLFKRKKYFGDMGTLRL